MVYVGILVFGALVFFGISESVSPFKRPNSHVAARRWHLGRRLAIIGMAILLLCVQFGPLLGLNRIQQLVAGGALWLVAAGILVLARKHIFRGRSVQRRAQVESKTSTPLRDERQQVTRSLKDRVLIDGPRAISAKTKAPVDIEL